MHDGTESGLWDALRDSLARGQDPGEPNGHPVEPGRGARTEAHPDGVIRVPDHPGSEQGADTSAVVLRSMLSQLDARTAVIINETWEEMRELEGYERLSPAQVEQVLQMVGRSASIFLRCLATGTEEVTGADKEFYLHLGASRAWSGVPLDNLKKAFRICYERANAHLTRVAHQHGEPGANTSGMLSGRSTALYQHILATIEEG
ncbi:MAG TPA: hypothetical protein VGA69_09350 [Nitriliruptorales bacterium]